MSMSKYKVPATIAISDMVRAVDFHEGRVGLSVGENDGPDDTGVMR